MQRSGNTNDSRASAVVWHPSAQPIGPDRIIRTLRMLHSGSAQFQKPSGKNTCRSSTAIAEAKVTADTISFASVHATLKAIPSDYASAAGGNQTISCFDELWAYTSERSRRLFDEMIPPPTRKIACRLTVTHAGFDGESVLLEELYTRGKDLPLIGPDLHAGDGLLMFWSHKPIAPWQDQNWLAQMRRSLRPNQYLRMIENRWVSTETSFIEMSWWHECVDPDAKMLTANQSLPIWVGIDASVKHDSTAIVAVTWDAAANKCKLITHRIFQPSPDQPLDFEATVEATILDLKRRFRIQRVLYDPYQMAASGQRLRGKGVPIEEYPQSTPNITAASPNLYELIKAPSGGWRFEFFSAK
jgi:hypothetical protein